MEEKAIRARPTKVNDEYADLREEIIAKANVLHNGSLIEATMKPKQKKYKDEIDELAKKIDEHEINLEELQHKIEKEKKRYSGEQAKTNDAEALELVPKIEELEGRLSQLLQEKAYILENMNSE